VKIEDVHQKSILEQNINKGQEINNHIGNQTFQLVLQMGDMNNK
jgi:hypothetical protein